MIITLGNDQPLFFITRVNVFYKRRVLKLVDLFKKLHYQQQKWNHLWKNEYTRISVSPIYKFDLALRDGLENWWVIDNRKAADRHILILVLYATYCRDTNLATNYKFIRAFTYSTLKSAALLRVMLATRNYTWLRSPDIRTSEQISVGQEMQTENR